MGPGRPPTSAATIQVALAERAQSRRAFGSAKRRHHHLVREDLPRFVDDRELQIFFGSEEPEEPALAELCGLGEA